MVKHILCYCILTLTLETYGQIERGSMLAGGSLGVSYSATPRDTASAFTISIAPRMGHFVHKNVAIGAQPTFTYHEFKRSSFGFDTYRNQLFFGLGPFVRYYGKIGEKVYLFGHASPQVGILQERVSKDEKQPYYKGVQVNWETGAGICFLLNEHVAIEPSLFYTGNWRKTDLVTPAITMDGQGLVSHGFILNLGFQLFIHKKK